MWSRSSYGSQRPAGRRPVQRERMENSLVVIRASVLSDGSPRVALAMIDSQLMPASEEKRREFETAVVCLNHQSFDPTSRIAINLSDYTKLGIKIGDKVSVDLRKLPEPLIARDVKT